MKLRPVRDDKGLVGYSFFCPGCEHRHVFFTKGEVTWEFNGDRQKPTFTPSLRNQAPDHVNPKERCCHLNVTAGRIHYHGDCTHDYTGKTIDLLDE
jgi:hypothetical protein